MSDLGSPTLEEVQRVRAAECVRHGHSYTAIASWQSGDPQTFICDNCSKSWSVVPDDPSDALSRQLGTDVGPGLWAAHVGEGPVVTVLVEAHVSLKARTKAEALLREAGQPSDIDRIELLKVGKEREVRVP